MELASHAGFELREAKGPLEMECFQEISLLTSYQVVTPQRLGRERREASNSSSVQDKVSYAVEIEGKEYTIHLEKNKELLPKDFTVYTYDKEGKLQLEYPDVQDHCHYQGVVEGSLDSLVAVSTCSGLRGLVTMGNVTYGIEPMDPSSGSEHILYRLDNVKREPTACAVSAEGWDREPAEGNPHPSMTQLLRRKRAVLHQTRYVELFIVVDKEKFEDFGKSETEVREHMVQLANFLDSMYVMLNIRIVLVGLEIWKHENLISTDGGAGDVLANFVQWREKNLFGRISIQMFASIMAHELGHNLGMNHDDERVCHCGASSCIMSSGASGSRNFSSCSAEDFEKLTLNKGGSCLLNVPRPDETYSMPYCGNRLVDAGEECDCGSPKLLPGGTECRASTNECDLPEYCNGSSQFCQPDFTVQNGHPCHNQQAYCYNGVCQYYDAQCQDIFGSKAKAAPNICFAEVNSKGDRFGNCGFHGHDYKKCSSWNAMCGKLQCENVKAMPVFGIKPAIIQTPIRGTTCWGVDFQLGSDVPDPGMVNEGTKCGNGKICRHFQCVSASVLNYDCDVEKQCHGHGVCNNNRNCHCEAGWAPPFYKDTSLRNGLLVFFFLVLPLLVAAALAFAKRDRLKRGCRRLMSRCHSSLQSPPPRPDTEARDCQQRGFSRGMPYAPRPVPMDMHPNTFPVPAYPVSQHPQQPFQQPYYSPAQYPLQQPQRVPSSAFLSDDFQTYVSSKEGSWHSGSAPIEAGCHYWGYVDGFPSSAVSLSTCLGLRGLLQFENVSYGIQPLGNAPAFQHVLYPVREGHRAAAPPAQSSPKAGLAAWDVLDKALEDDEYSYLGSDLNAATQKIIQAFNLINNYHGNVTLESFSVLLAQVLGHSLGMSSDSPRGCSCPGRVCIMSPEALYFRGAKAFSNCSIRAFETFLKQGRGACLFQSPRLVRLARNGAVCGNGVVEPGEQCDCGTAKFKRRNSLCRPAADATCDLPEFCSGASASCPPDMYVQDGHDCGQGTGYCYQGRCQSSDLQCKKFYGRDIIAELVDSKNAPVICYEEINAQRDRFGNCGFKDRHSYRPCAWRDKVWLWKGLQRALEDAEMAWLVLGSSLVLLVLTAALGLGLWRQQLLGQCGGERPGTDGSSRDMDRQPEPDLELSVEAEPEPAPELQREPKPEPELETKTDTDPIPEPALGQHHGH
ncbi:hypothetical protein TURU_025529 [Turdus rufiventris]|nr:hypothetical protein TURU_025529 [Turdus rufiventris]